MATIKATNTRANVNIVNVAHKVFISVLVAAGLTFSAHSSAQGDAEAGKEKAQACAGCHGADGNSTVASFPKLAGQGRDYLIKQMKDVQEGRRAIVEMTGILDGLTEQDFKNIAEFYATQPASVGQADKELVEEGQKIYRGGIPAIGVAACTACHGPAGKGMELAKFPALGGQHAEYTVKQLLNFQTGARANDGDSRVMRSIASRLSEREMKAVASYIAGLHQ